MTVDANKTGLTRQVTELAAMWLGERGFKPVESEVQLTEGWVADVAGCASLTRTEAMDMKLIRRKPPFVRNCQQDLNAWHAEFRALPGILTAAIEVKTSRSDFTRDKKWTRTAPVHLLYLAYPAGLVKADELPDHVGLLTCGESTIKTIRPAKVMQVSLEQVLSVVFEIAVRRDHFTAYERYREFNRQARDSENGRTNILRMKDAMRAAIDIVTKKRTPAEAFMWRGIKFGKQLEDAIDLVERELQRAESMS